MNQNQLTEFAGRYVYLCEDSTEGIFTAVYDAFAGAAGRAGDGDALG